ncbi:helix-turn-helix transcriptional regulator [Streptomyces zhihengii]|uniref:Helix-turn-helix transcriptional regulator n=2 Tax=Streptomyces zhihengii TaxID=1818004 RepID=A0ABS2UTZ8_9ACTN|nr:helix-turn-helix transcriptional regulator [Streptomyces zhihengii]
MSLRALSRLVGLDRGYLSRLERGLVHRPADDKLRAIAAALEVSTTDITERRDITMTTALRPIPPVDDSGTDPAELVHYTPYQVADHGWLPMAGRTLRDMAVKRRVPHSQAGGRITFTLAHVREIAASYEVRPITETKHGA